MNFTDKYSKNAVNKNFKNLKLISRYFFSGKIFVKNVYSTINSIKSKHRSKLMDKAR